MAKSKAIAAAEAALDQARADLAAAQNRKEQIAASEAEAAATVDSYTEWRRQSVLASTEVERITTLIARREAELQGEIDRAAAAEQKALEDEFETEIPDEQAEKITTVQQAIDYIKANKKA